MNVPWKSNISKSIEKINIGYLTYPKLTRKINKVYHPTITNRKLFFFINKYKYLRRYSKRIIIIIYKIKLKEQ